MGLNGTLFVGHMALKMQDCFLTQVPDNNRWIRYCLAMELESREVDRKCDRLVSSAA